VSNSRDTTSVPTKHETGWAQGRSELVEEKYFFACGGNLTTIPRLSGSQARRCTDYTIPDVYHVNITLTSSMVLSYCLFCMCTRITSTESPSFCMATFNASLTKLKAFLPQSCDCSYYVSRQMLAPPALLLQKNTNVARSDSLTLPTCDISPGWLTLPVHEAGDIAELLLL